MDTLKLLALDSEDLQILSAHMQDAVINIGDMTYLPAEQNFVAIVSRFNWMKVQEKEEVSKEDLERRQTRLRFSRVLGAQVHNLKLNSKSNALELLAISYEATTEPEGYITLVFSGDSAVRLHVECIEAELNDVGAVWSAKSLPEHKIEEEAETGS